MCMHAYVQSSTSHFHLLLFNLLYVFGYPFQLSRLCTPISIENVELSIVLVVRIEDGGEDASPKSSVSKRSSASPMRLMSKQSLRSIPVCLAFWQYGSWTIEGRWEWGSSAATTSCEDQLERRERKLTERELSEWWKKADWMMKENWLNYERSRNSSTIWTSRVSTHIPSYSANQCCDHRQACIKLFECSAGQDEAWNEPDWQEGQDPSPSWFPELFPYILGYKHVKNQGFLRIASIW
jgi:hypothetical protein